MHFQPVRSDRWHAAGRKRRDRAAARGAGARSSEATFRPTHHRPPARQQGVQTPEWRSRLRAQPTTEPECGSGVRVAKPRSLDASTGVGAIAGTALSFSGGSLAD
jgi:hypothetical protein